MKSIELKSRAKINLSIDVLGKREDGYHLVEMIMQTIDLYDVIKIKELDTNTITINSNSSNIPLNENNIEKVKLMAEEWFKYREVPEGENFDMERHALKKAFENYKELGLESLVLMENEKVLAFTMASRNTKEIFDVHFEKAQIDLEGGYTAINYLFANYIHDKYPEIKFLNREEDMGLEGLRKAKLSYRPKYMQEKISAVLK